MAAVTAKLQLLSQLERKYGELRKEKSFSDPAVRQLLSQIKSVAQQIVLTNIHIAQEKNVELKLWNLCFHKPISELRKRIADAELRKLHEHAERARKALLSILSDAITFYLALVMKLQIVYGDVGCKLTASQQARVGSATLSEVEPGPEQIDVSKSVARCLCSAGDLTRYEIGASAGLKDWSRADEYYEQAAMINPESGQAYNQRAVLAMMDPKDPKHLPAVYYYIRSLATPQPFTAAIENLNDVFQHVCSRYVEVKDSQEGKGEVSTFGWKLPDLMRHVEAHMLHLNGLLFTGLDFDKFDEALSIAFPYLHNLLEKDAVVKGPSGFGPQSTEVALFQLCAIATFHPDYIASRVEEARGDELAKYEQMREPAIFFIFILIAQLAPAISNATSESQMGIASSPILPALLILLKWLSIHHECLGLGEGRFKEAHKYALKGLKECLIATAAACESNQISIPNELSQAQNLLALPEDLELRGFGPLSESQARIDWGQKVTKDHERERLKHTLFFLDQIASGVSSSIETSKWSRYLKSFMEKRALSFTPSKLPTNSEKGPTGLVTEIDEDTGEVFAYKPQNGINGARDEKAPQFNHEENKKPKDSKALESETKGIDASALLQISSQDKSKLDEALSHPQNGQNDIPEVTEKAVQENLDELMNSTSTTPFQSPEKDLQSPEKQPQDIGQSSSSSQSFPPAPDYIALDSQTNENQPGAVSKLEDKDPNDGSQNNQSQGPNPQYSLPFQGPSIIPETPQTETGLRNPETGFRNPEDHLNDPTLPVRDSIDERMEYTLAGILQEQLKEEITKGQNASERKNSHNSLPGFAEGNLNPPEVSQSTIPPPQNGFDRQGSRSQTPQPITESLVSAIQGQSQGGDQGLGSLSYQTNINPALSIFPQGLPLVSQSAFGLVPNPNSSQNEATKQYLSQFGLPQSDISAPLSRQLAGMVEPLPWRSIALQGKQNPNYDARGQAQTPVPNFNPQPYGTVNPPQQGFNGYPASLGLLVGNNLNSAGFSNYDLLSNQNYGVNQGLNQGLGLQQNLFNQVNPNTALLAQLQAYGQSAFQPQAFTQNRQNFDSNSALIAAQQALLQNPAPIPQNFGYNSAYGLQSFGQQGYNFPANSSSSSRLYGKSKNPNPLGSLVQAQQALMNTPLPPQNNTLQETANPSNQQNANFWNPSLQIPNSSASNPPGFERPNYFGATSFQQGLNPNFNTSPQPDLFQNMLPQNGVNQGQTNEDKSMQNSLLHTFLANSGNTDSNLGALQNSNSVNRNSEYQPQHPDEFKAPNSQNNGQNSSNLSDRTESRQSAFTQRNGGHNARMNSGILSEASGQEGNERPKTEPNIQHLQELLGQHNRNSAQSNTRLVETSFGTWDLPPLSGQNGQKQPSNSLPYNLPPYTMDPSHLGGNLGTAGQYNMFGLPNQGQNTSNQGFDSSNQQDFGRQGESLNANTNPNIQQRVNTQSNVENGWNKLQNPSPLSSWQAQNPSFYGNQEQNERWS